MLKFKRPSNLVYKAGQYIIIGTTAISKAELHPFTLTSSPNEEYMSVHIRAVGPFTKRIRQVQRNC